MIHPRLEEVGMHSYLTDRVNNGTLLIQAVKDFDTSCELIPVWIGTLQKWRCVCDACIKVGEELDG